MGAPYISSLMICELCGKPAVDGYRIRLEGGVVSACRDCESLGEKVEAVREATPKPPEKPKPAPKAVEAAADAGYDVVEGFGGRVKVARERLRLSQKDLGMFINEPESVIHRVELGSYEPAEELAHKLEHKLGVKLLVKHEEPVETRALGEIKEVTLGDLVVVRKRMK